MRRKILWAALCAAIFLFPAFGSAAIENGGFESNFDNWGTNGITSISSVVNLPKADGSGDVVSFLPFEGDKMAGITYSALQIDGFVWDNYIYQTVNLGPNDKHLSFYYNFWTYDEAPFDNPGFLVEINGKTEFSVKAGDIGDGVAGNLHYTDWQFYSIDVSGFYSDDPGRPASIRISFNAGNTADSLNPSGVFIDAVAMNVPVPASVLLLASGIVGLVGLRRRKL